MSEANVEMMLRSCRLMNQAKIDSWTSDQLASAIADAADLNAELTSLREKLHEERSFRETRVEAARESYDLEMLNRLLRDPAAVRKLLRLVGDDR